MTTPASLGPEAIRQLTMPTDPWLSCDDCFDQLDAVLEETLTHAAPMGDSFRVHLRACAVCHQEAHSLAALVAPDYGIDPARAEAELDAVLRDDGSPAV
ncbi:hypothetical protein GCM10009844_22990 [Nocardioides koreensis]|uniref:Zf-HC2 domain-containing protein n=1 Tax=Nocardioides koreensis TaxID=433651 RepID=A0ABP5LKL2_9ACTN